MGVTPSVKHRYLATLDGWRALAIIGVLICHGFDAPCAVGGPLANARCFAWTRLGSYGVDIFFGLSGLLITKRLLEEWRDRGGIALGSFYARRAFRILPPLLVYLGVLGLLATVASLAVTPLSWLGSLLFFRNYLSSAAPDDWYTGHFWSLSVEEHFYLLWPMTLVWLGQGRARAFAVGFALVVAAWRWHEYERPWFGQLLPPEIFFARSDIRLDGLMWGAWSALMLHETAWRQWWTQAASRWPWLGSAILLVMTLKWNAVPLIGLQGLLIALLITGTVLRPQGLRARVLEHPWLRWLGRLSYSLYIWQQLFLVSSRVPRPLPFDALQSWPWNIVATGVAAILSYYLVERPMIEVGRRLLAARQTRRQGVPVSASAGELVTAAAVKKVS